MTGPIRAGPPGAGRLRAVDHHFVGALYVRGRPGGSANGDDLADRGDGAGAGRGDVRPLGHGGPAEVVPS